MPTVTEALAAWAVSIPAGELTAGHDGARRALVDTLGVALAGCRAPGVDPVCEQIAEWGGRPDASLWLVGTRVPAGPAALANSVMVHALDLDDVHIPSTTHITSVMVPTALAVGQAVGASGVAVLDALTVGIEVATRLGIPHKQNRRHQGYLPTTILGGFGAAAATARLLDLSEDQAADALGLYHAHACGNRQALFDHTLAKRLQPGIAARGGIESAYLARRGVTGARRVVEGQAGLYEIFGAPGCTPTVDEIMAPREDFEIDRLSYKRWACCGASHPLMLAVLDLITEHDLWPADIERIETYGVAGGFVGAPWQPDPRVDPQVLAQFCAPFEVAALICHRRFGPAEVEPDTVAADAEAAALAQRIEVHPKSAFGSDYPGVHAVRIHTKDGRVFTASRDVDDIFGPTIGNDEFVDRKFADNAAYAGYGRGDDLRQAIADLADLPDINRFIEEYFHGTD